MTHAVLPHRQCSPAAATPSPACPPPACRSFFAEECDSLQGFQVLADDLSGFGHLAAHVLQVTRLSVWCWMGRLR